MLWKRKFIAEGKGGDTSGKDVLFDKRGNINHVGLTGTNMFGPSFGQQDFYLLKLGLDNVFINKQLNHNQ